MPTDPASQIDTFRQAVRALGGIRAAARALGCNERTVRKLGAGELDLNPGWLASTATALLDHAERCRQLERRISPAFADNLTIDQRHARPHGNTRYAQARRRAAPAAATPAADQAAASATARPQAPEAQRRNSAEDQGPDGPRRTRTPAENKND